MKYVLELIKIRIRSLKMKILLVALNSKYIHSNPAVYSLKAYADEILHQCCDPAEMPGIEIAEYTVTVSYTHLTLPTNLWV